MSHGGLTSTSSTVLSVTGGLFSTISAHSSSLAWGAGLVGVLKRVVPTSCDLHTDRLGWVPEAPKLPGDPSYYVTTGSPPCILHLCTPSTSTSTPTSTSVTTLPSYHFTRWANIVHNNFFYMRPHKLQLQIINAKILPWTLTKVQNYCNQQH